VPGRVAAFGSYLLNYEVDARGHIGAIGRQLPGAEKYETCPCRG
jgi:hypothetical protein